MPSSCFVKFMYAAHTYTSSMTSLWKWSNYLFLVPEKKPNFPFSIHFRPSNQTSQHENSILSDTQFANVNRFTFRWDLPLPLIYDNAFQFFPSLSLCLFSSFNDLAPISIHQSLSSSCIVTVSGISDSLVLTSFLGRHQHRLRCGRCLPIFQSN